MKKWLIGSIVGAIIVFVWQGLSWMVLGIHADQMKYHPAQTEIMELLSAKTPEDGLYSMPSAPTQKEQKAMMKDLDGKPTATIIYHKSYNTDMTMRFVRGFLVDIFLVVSLIYILSRGLSTPIPRRVLSASVAFGLAAYLMGPYMGHIWFDLPWHMIKGDLIDAIAAWTLCGIWLGWWLNRSANKQ